MINDPGSDKKRTKGYIIDKVFTVVHIDEGSMIQTLMTVWADVILSFSE